ncbi:hypothetical protein [Kitasatospora terrestris]
MTAAPARPGRRPGPAPADGPLDARTPREREALRLAAEHRSP